MLASHFEVLHPVQVCTVQSLCQKYTKKGYLQSPKGSVFRFHLLDHFSNTHHLLQVFELTNNDMDYTPIYTINPTLKSKQSFYGAHDFQSLQFHKKVPLYSIHWIMSYELYSYQGKNTHNKYLRINQLKTTFHFDSMTQ